MTAMRLPETVPAPPAATAPIIIRGSDGSRVTMRDLWRGIRNEECYYVVPASTTDEQITQAIAAGGGCCYATTQHLPPGSMLVVTDCSEDAVLAAYLHNGWSASALERWDRGECGTGRTDALELAIERACDMVREGSERVE